MFEVIIERPRYRWGRWRARPANGREVAQIRRDPDGARRCESMRHHWGRPLLNENLAPLARFLQSRVGRPWDDVYAEICAEIAPSSAVQKHVLDHVRDFVVVNTRLVDGEVVGPDRYGRPGPVGGPGRRMQFYVCPSTGALKCAPRRRVRAGGPGAR